VRLTPSTILPTSSARLGVAALLLLAGGAVACESERVLGVPAEQNAKFCRTSPISLEVGQIALSDGFGKRCRFVGIAGAEYVLAWVDVRSIEESRTQVESELEPYAVRVTIAPDAQPAARDGAARDASLSTGGMEAAHRPTRLRPASVELAPYRPRHRDTPFVLDEAFNLEDDATGLPRPARIVRVYHGAIAVARWESELGAELPAYLGQLDTAMAMLDAEGFPAMRSAYVDAFPRSTGAGQTLILLREDLAIPAWSLAEVHGDTLFGWIETLPFLWRSPERLAVRLAHEMTHLYQMEYMHASRPLAGLPTSSGASFWAIEGAADLMSYEMLRRLAGIAPNANHDWRTPPTDTVTKLFQQRAQPAGGLLTDGFDSAMGFLRDLAARRVRNGEPHEDALRAVSRGAIEGWYGHDGVAQRLGLVPRMQATFGSGWHPATALLDWALGYAGDDLTPNTQYQDLNSLRIWDLPLGQSYGWRADAFLSASGTTAFLFKRYGSPGFARLFDNGAGIHVEIDGFEFPIVWKILRIR
jgi:hypothetical protein